MDTTKPQPKLDAISLTRLSRMHPKVRAESIALYGAACQALTGRATVRITQTLRTFPEQTALYAQGRTTKGPNASKKDPLGDTVTDAKAGQSYHNYGVALDIVLLIDDKEVSWDRLKDFDGDKVPDWMEVVKVFKDAGWSWGGDWKSRKDYPHFEKTFGKTWQQLLALHDAKKTDPAGYVIFP